MEQAPICPDRMVEYFSFLDHLQASGKINVLNAASYLRVEFADLGYSQSKNILAQWMKAKP